MSRVLKLAFFNFTFSLGCAAIRCFDMFGDQIEWFKRLGQNRDICRLKVPGDDLCNNGKMPQMERSMHDVPSSTSIAKLSAMLDQRCTHRALKHM